MFYSQKQQKFKAALICDHYPVYRGDDGFTNIVVFVWASAEETQAMQRCLYKDMQKIGKMNQYILFKQQHSQTFKFCNKSVNAAEVPLQYDDVAGIRALGFFMNDTKNNGRVEI